jgi:hypothetical protein
MLGAIILDDYYFYFEETEVESLIRGEVITGLFAYHKMKCIFTASVRKPTNHRVSSGIHIYEEKKRAYLYIMENDFKEWFVNPIDRIWAMDHLMPTRFGSWNVYAVREGGKIAKMRKGELEQVLIKAE